MNQPIGDYGLNDDDVRSRPHNELKSDIATCPKSATTGLPLCKKISCHLELYALPAIGRINLGGRGLTFLSTGRLHGARSLALRTSS
jgi:hypothetical protein